MKSTWKNLLLIPLLLALARTPARAVDDATNGSPTPSIAAADAAASANSSMYGVGISLINVDGDDLTILTMQDGKPAAKTKKIKVGDRLIAVAEGTNEPVAVSRMDVGEATKKLRGPKGSEVRLTLIPLGKDREIVVPIVRGEIYNGEIHNMVTGVRSNEVVATKPIRHSDNSVQITPSHIHLGGDGGNDVDIDVPNFTGVHGLGDGPYIIEDIVIVAMVVPFLVLFLIIAMFFKSRQKRNQQLHDTLRLMIEKGVPIPPELIVPPDRIRRRVASDLRTGLVILAIGAGVTVMIARVGIILVLVGVAFLITWFIEKKNTGHK